MRRSLSSSPESGPWLDSDLAGYLGWEVGRAESSCIPRTGRHALQAGDFPMGTKLGHKTEYLES